jgi:hypothetical protein
MPRAVVQDGANDPSHGSLHSVVEHIVEYGISMPRSQNAKADEAIQSGLGEGRTPCRDQVSRNVNAFSKCLVE